MFRNRFKFKGREFVYLMLHRLKQFYLLKSNLINKTTSVTLHVALIKPVAM